MSALFITGTGTDVGKTYVAERLIRTARELGSAVRAFKPVASGAPSVEEADFAQSDTARLLQAQNLAVNITTAEACTPWRFRAPLSPDMAAAAEGRALSLSTIVARCRLMLEEDLGLTIIEGVGGVMSPICSDATNLDLIQALETPVLLVAGSYLGAISHCLTAIEALRTRGAELTCLLVNESVPPCVDLDATAATIQRFASDAPLAVLRRGDERLPERLRALVRG